MPADWCANPTSPHHPTNPSGWFPLCEERSRRHFRQSTWCNVNFQIAKCISWDLRHPKTGATYFHKAHSVDYAGWRTAAATSYLLTPNGYRKITFRNKNGHAARPSKAELHVIRLACKHLGIPRKNLPGDFEARATFNAYVATRIMKAKSVP